MSGQIIECVPNVSEGRDASVISKIAAEIGGVRGVHLLHTDSNPDANRTVFTFAGQPGPVLSAAEHLAEACVRLIDMRSQKGEHPRIGALDVLPIVPIQGITLTKCAELASELGRELAQKFEIPVFLYEASARDPRRAALPMIRKGQFEGLAAKLLQPEWQPDYGPAVPHKSAGAIVVGARNILIAFNISLKTTDVSLASSIAAAVRSRPNSIPRRNTLPACRAIGWSMPGYGCAQVSLNLLDFKVTGLFDAFRAVSLLAVEHGTEVTGCEPIGLIPQAAIDDLIDSLGLKHADLDESLITAEEWLRPITPIKDRILDRLLSKALGRDIRAGVW